MKKKIEKESPSKLDFDLIGNASIKELQEEIKDTLGIAYTLNNIGYVFFNQKKLGQSIIVYNKYEAMAFYYKFFYSPN